MNQIHPSAYQQPSFGPGRGIYPQQPLYAQPGAGASGSSTPHHSQQSPHPLSYSTSQSQLDSPQHSHPQAASPPPAQPSPVQQHQPQGFHPQSTPGHGGFPGVGGNGGISQPGHIAAGSDQTQFQQQQQQRYPMAAPPLPASIQRQQSPGSAGSSSQPNSPMSSARSVLERKRVAILLDINLVLLEDLNELLAQGKGGPVSSQQAALFRNQGLPDKRPAEEYVQTFYRLQANLAYLYSQPDMQALNPQRQEQSSQNSKGPAHPPHFMHAPPHLTMLEDKYAALRQLFPGWVGKDSTVGAGTIGTPAASSSSA